MILHLHEVLTTLLDYNVIVLMRLDMKKENQ